MGKFKSKTYVYCYPPTGDLYLLKARVGPVTVIAKMFDLVYIGVL